MLRAQPGDVLVLGAVGDVLLAAMRPGDAAERYKAALELDSNNVAPPGVSIPSGTP